MNKFYKLWIPIFIGMTMLFFFLFPTPALATNTGVFTMELWVKPTSSVASQALVGKSEELRMFTDASGNPGCQIKTTSWQTAVTSSTAITLNTWSHIACFYDKTNIKIYVNGVQTGSQALTTVPDDTANTFKIGQDDSASTPYSNLTGIIDQFQFYNYARTQKQIVADMLGGSVIASGARQSSIGYWKMDEGADNTCSGGTNDTCNSGSGGSSLDGAGSGFASPATSTSGWTQSGKFDKALIFDGTNDYINVPHHTTFNWGTGAFSISFWIKTTSSSSTFVMGRNNGVGGWYISYNEAGGGSDFKVRFQLYGELTGATGTTAVNDGNWHHITAVRDSSTVIYLYTNGKLEGTGNANSANVDLSNTALAIGDLRVGAGSYFGGTLDEVKIYNYALTADEVKLDYNKGSSLVLGSLSDNSTYQVNAANQEYCVPGDSTSCAAPVARWDFEEGSGTSARDTSGNTNTGTLGGDGSGTDLPAWKSGKSGKGLSFDGTDDYVTAADSTSLAVTSGFTIEAWIKLNSTSAQQGFLGQWGGSNDGYRQMQLATSGTPLKARILVSGTGNDQIFTDGNTTLDTNWHHITATYNGSSIKIYLDGKDDTGTTTGAVPATLSNSGDSLVMGSFGPSGGRSIYANAIIDQVKIFNYARSAAQIAWDYNRGDPVGWWRFDECQGDTTYDNSGNGNTGTITIGGSGEDTIGTCNTSSTAWGSGATGKRNASLSFDGTDDYVGLGDILDSSSTMTWGAWFKLNASGGNSAIIFKRVGTSEYAQYGITTYANNVYCLQSADGSNWTTNISTSEPSINVWHHVACTNDGTNARMYLDGVQVGTPDSSPATSLAASTAALNIGFGRVDAANAYFNGQVDDVRVYNYALTPVQVKLLYNNGAINFSPSTGAP